MLISYILQEQKKNLTFLSRSDENVEIVTGQIKELKKHMITKEMLEDVIIKTDNEYRKAKLEDIALLYEKCRRRKYIVPINVQKDSERTKIILEYLNEHYNENIQQQVMAKKFHFTREYFARFFKNQTGMTFKEYLTVYRIEKAKEELLYSNKNLLDIALNNGFSNETRFISNFKKYYNQTPSRFRKENKRN